MSKDEGLDSNYSAGPPLIGRLKARESRLQYKLKSIQALIALLEERPEVADGLELSRDLFE